MAAGFEKVDQARAADTAVEREIELWALAGGQLRDDGRPQARIAPMPSMNRRLRKRLERFRFRFMR